MLRRKNPAKVWLLLISKERAISDREMVIPRDYSHSVCC